MPSASVCGSAIVQWLLSPCRPTFGSPYMRPTTIKTASSSDGATASSVNPPPVQRSGVCVRANLPNALMWPNKETAMRTRSTEDDPYPDYERRLDALDATDRQERWRRWGFWSLGVVVLFGSLGVLQAVSRPAPTPPVPSPVASTQ